MTDELVLPDPESVAINLAADELDRQAPRVYEEVNGPPHGEGRLVCVPKPEFLAMQRVVISLDHYLGALDAEDVEGAQVALESVTDEMARLALLTIYAPKVASYEPHLDGSNP